MTVTERSNDAVLGLSAGDRTGDRAGRDDAGRDADAPGLIPAISDSDFRLYLGEALDVLVRLPAESVHCVVTSPPYWGLRDYGEEGQLGLERLHDCAGWATGEPCGECYVCRMVAVFREVRRVLRLDGTLWLNLGDTFNSYPGNSRKGGDISRISSEQRPKLPTGSGLLTPALKSKDLAGIPWRVALALQADGWWLRSENIWAKRNTMPESVADRTTRAHEQVFMLAKSSRYFYDRHAVLEPTVTQRAPGRAIAETHHYAPDNGGNEGLSGELARVRARLVVERRPQDETLDGIEPPAGPAYRSGNRERKHGAAVGAPDARDGDLGRSIPWEDDGDGRNMRSVWEIATTGSPEKHFAIFPDDLVRRCIAAGTPEHGVCSDCSAPWVRRLEEDDDGRRVWKGEWVPTCDCHGGDPRLTANAPAVVLDPFMGSGTVAIVARRMGRHAVGVELNPEYVEIIERRTSQLGLLT